MTRYDWNGLLTLLTFGVVLGWAGVSIIEQTITGGIYLISAGLLFEGVAFADARARVRRRRRRDVTADHGADTL